MLSRADLYLSTLKPITVDVIAQAGRPGMLLCIGLCSAQPPDECEVSGWAGPSARALIRLNGCADSQLRQPRRLRLPGLDRPRHPQAHSLCRLLRSRLHRSLRHGCRSPAPAPPGGFSLRADLFVPSPMYRAAGRPSVSSHRTQRPMKLVQRGQRDRVGTMMFRHRQRRPGKAGRGLGPLPSRGKSDRRTNTSRPGSARGAIASLPLIS